MRKSNRRKIIFYVFCFIVFLQSCNKQDIQFATGLGESYTGVISVDTISVNLSTYFIDSFVTTNPGTFLFGRYKDPKLGIISAKPFMSLSPPTDITIATEAVYDSAVFIMKLNKYYYGDTTRMQTIQLKELNATIEYTYGSNVYNTTSIAEKPVILGAKQLLIRPNKDDSVMVRLNDAKGYELFYKLQQRDDDMATQEAFTNYFKGLSVSFSGDDTSAVYGMSDSVYLRVYYHTSTPVSVNMTKDFRWNYGDTYFNQVLSDRSNTPIPSLLTGSKEIASSLLDDNAYTQSDAGVLLKATFPSARGILKLNSNVRVLTATLRLRIARGSYDNAVLRLPEFLYLASTDGSNAIGTSLELISGNMIYNTPVVDYIYDAVPYYNFNVTNYVNTLVSNGGLQDYGVFLMSSSPGSNNNLGRGVFSNSGIPTKGAQLILTLLTVDN